MFSMFGNVAINPNTVTYISPDCREKNHCTIHMNKGQCLVMDCSVARAAVILSAPATAERLYSDHMNAQEAVIVALEGKCKALEDRCALLEAELKAK